MKHALWILILCSIAAGSVACASAPATPVRETVVVQQVVQQTVVVPQTVPVPQTVVVVATPAPTKAPEPAKSPADLNAIQAAYKTSTHSNDWGEGRGPNTLCARCHSPRNWDPAAKTGPPPNCVACKFPFDKEVRKPPPGTNVFIEQKDWKNIGCDVCHQVANNVVDPKPVMWNQATGKYDTIVDNTALCEKCHTDDLGGSKHKVALGGPAHTAQIGLTAPRPQQCTDCHDPHSQKASCTNCHKTLSKAAGHDAAHAKVACDACHDAAGLKVGPNSDNTRWVAFVSSSSPTGGPPSLSPVTSHVLQKAVDCTRCHYDNNPQKLRSLVTPTATRAATTSARPDTGTPVLATPTVAK